MGPKERWETHRWSLFATFWDRVDHGDLRECWPWKGSCSGEGYGSIKVGGVRFQAHRMSLALFTGHCPRDLIACHRCDNPVCCNPNHLFWGTVYDNRHDCISKGRAKGFPRKIPCDRTILAKRRAGAKYVDLARELSVSPTSARRAARRAARMEGMHV